MEDLILILISGGILVGAFVVKLSAALKPTSMFDTVAEAGFAFESHHLIARRSVDGISLHALITLNEEQRPTELKISVDRPRLPIELTLSPEGVLGAVADLAGLTDFEVGEVRFDSAVRCVCGNPAQGLALLSQAARDAIVVALRHGAIFKDGRWSATFSSPGPGAPALAALADALAGAQAALEAGLQLGVAEGLAARIRDDRAPGVRRHALQLLIHRDLASPELLQEATGDLDPAVQLTAAQQLGSGGRPVLVRLLRTASRTWRFRAALALAEEELEPALRAQVEDTLVAALDDPEQAEHAATVLGAWGSPRVAAALGQAARSGPARSAARRALASVKERLDPASVGAISLATSGSAGALSEPSPE